LILVLEIIASMQAEALGLDARRVVREGPLTIGRALFNQWTLPDPQVSARHARIERVGERFVLHDLSTNGVYLNGSQLRWTSEAPLDLQSGDCILIGVFEIRVTYLDEQGLPHSTGRGERTSLRSPP
jgi:type VI secretion system protein ImpI